MSDPRFVLVTGAAEEPVALDAALEHLRADDTDAAMVQRLISAARAQAEHFTGRVLTAQTWDAFLDAFPVRVSPHAWGYSWLYPSDAYPLASDAITLAKGPLVSVTSVTYTDAAGATQTLSPTLYTLDKTIRPGDTGGRVVLNADASWPVTAEAPNAVKVRFTVGPADFPSGVPEDIQAAILLVVGDLYAHRETEIVGAAVSRFALTAERLLSPYKLRWIA